MPSQTGGISFAKEKKKRKRMRNHVIVQGTIGMCRVQKSLAVFLKKSQFGVSQSVPLYSNSESRLSVGRRP